MRQLQRDERPGKVCIPIVEMGMEKALTAIRKASPLADLLELRVDYMRNPDLAQLVKGRRKPFIVTNRRKEEGGRFQGDEKARGRILEEALSLGTDYVDIEMRSEGSLIQALRAHQKSKKRETRIVLSFHDFQETPLRRDLQKLCDRMLRWEADVVKIVTFARSWQDNLNILDLITYARERGQKIVAFCMGDKGKMSRVVAPMVGAAWTYASLSKDRASAPGQVTFREMRRIWESLG